MRYAIISDVHANLEALEAVLADVRNREINEILFLGDAVGYGPNPNECVDLLNKHCKILLAGNHDWAAIGLTDIEYFNEYAKAAILWTREVLTPDSRKFIGALPVTRNIKRENMLLVHSTPKEPEAWHYLLTLWDAEINFTYFHHQVCMIGHSHLPFVIERVPSGEMTTHKNDTRIGTHGRYIINAGSVGQPRDRDPRACYAIFGDDNLKFVRLEYAIEKTQKKMRDAGLPVMLIERLSKGT
ncbi:MAG TPA: metallophosphoesterase family protein [Thermodesulfovibrionales bacterium]|nr:metallophosphoesterase family protein [Thermodesulfovibrionales bacterium]